MSRNNLALVTGEANLAEAMARAGRGLSAGSDGAQLANWANSTAPTSATLSNTAAGYTTLGGLWQAAALAGAATDYALFAYAVPAGKRLFVTGVHISPTIVTGAANATTATILQWGLGFNSTAVSLATASTGPDRVGVGFQSCLAALAIGGQIGPAIELSFPTPHVVEAEKYLHVILTIPVCTATSSEVLRGLVGINGYFG